VGTARVWRREAMKFGENVKTRNRVGFWPIPDVSNCSKVQAKGLDEESEGLAGL
jgi:hypothetical protein